ncbi:MAG: DNA-binding protein WhiA [Ruminococcaceae bacterium]|nr:DNA-binding protein WhiA [Oscillospiraceae bacterium]
MSISFSHQVKNELLKSEDENRCCMKSRLYGMALFSKNFSFKRITFQSENEGTTELFKRLLKELCNIDSKIEVSPSGKSFSVDINSKKNASKLMTFFGHNISEKNLVINHSNFDCDACRNAFIAGAFLSCGTISSPEKDYHLEFTAAYLNLAKSFITLLNEFELSPKLILRKGYNVVYFKDSEAIEDFLYIMGASASMFEMMNIKIVKEIRNSANRKANCETANIEKTIQASMPQIDAILKIKKKKGLDFLSKPLREMAQARLDNPELSLAELAASFEPPISKSGANHRLKRIEEIAKEL